MNLPRYNNTKVHLSYLTVNHKDLSVDYAIMMDNSDFLPTPSADSSARGSEFITYLLPNMCTN